MLSTESAHSLACSVIRPVQHRLLQRCASRRTVRHCPEASANSELCSSDCAPGVKTTSRQSVTASAAAVASPAADHVQVGSSDVQVLQRVHSSLPARPSNHGDMFVERQTPIEDDTQHFHVLSHRKSTPATDTDNADESMTHS